MLNISEEDWQFAAPNCQYAGTHQPFTMLLEKMDVIKMSNSNMSQSEQNKLLETIASIIE
jgi:hypothetical protein